MTLDPLINAPLAIQIHVLTVVPAAVLGAWMLFGRKGTRLHKVLGRVWLALMVMTSITSFFIHTIRMVGPFSPIHLLSVLTLVSSGLVVWSARTRRISFHRKAVVGMYWSAIGLAGAFTLVPGRLMNEVLLGGSKAAWPLVILLAAICGAVVVHVRRGGRFDWLSRRKTGVAGTGLAVLLAPMFLLGAGHDAMAAPDVTQIATHAPLWVWPLLAASLWLGWSRSRPRIVSKTRLMILPVVLCGIGLASFFANGASLAAAAMLVAALTAGSLAGERVGRGDAAVVDDLDRVHVPGEWVSMVLIVVIFLSRFAAGAAQDINPALAESLTIALPLALVSGFSIGLAGMRALVQAGYRA